MGSFYTRTYGKWIFSGEHTVLRGGPALVFPLFKKKLELEYTVGKDPLVVQAMGENADDIIELFPDVLAKALEILKIKDRSLTGTILFRNELPLGSGMGASSSLCVAFSRWFCNLGFLNDFEIYEFARQLENIFHGESSGVDIAVVLHEKPLVFRRPNAIEILNVQNSFTLYLSHTGQKGITKECVNQVNDFIRSYPLEGNRLDEQMNQITIEAIRLFQDNRESSENVEHMVSIIERGYQCFKEWGLTGGQVDPHIAFLKKQGAYAAKPTGSGGGGYVLSLWPERVTRTFDFEMIPLFK